MRRLARAFALVVGSAAATAVAATVGFTEDFNNGLGVWGGGSQVAIVLGGVDGPTDSFLRVREPTFPGQLGAFNSGPELTGDLVADGVTGYSFFLSNIDDNEPLEIHVGVGLAVGNFWLCIDGFTPPATGWQEFQVDLTDESRWVQIIGTGTFQEALAASNRLLFRHDLAPFIMAPNPTTGDFGVDNVTVLGAAPCPGDADGDADVDLDDLLLVLGGFGGPGPSGDLDDDGDVDLDDLLIVLGTFGVVC